MTWMERSSWSISGRTPASTGCERSATSVPGPRSTRIRGWSSWASTRRSSRSRRSSTTSVEAVRDMRVDYPIALDSDVRRLAGVQQPLLAGRVHRGRGGADPAPPVRRGRIRRVRTGRSSSSCATPVGTASATTSSPSRARGSRPRQTGRRSNLPRRTSATSKVMASRLRAASPSTSRVPTPCRSG